nr:hypothetical protein [Pedobacter panaciterrae]
MKKLTLLFALIFFSFTGMAQRITLSGSATIDPQKKLYKVQKSEISSLATKRFGKTKFLAKSIQDNAVLIWPEI